MALTSIVKKAVPTKLRPLAISAYLRGQRLHFTLYRRLFRPNNRYLAVAEQNNLTWFPPEWTSVDYENADILVNLETEYTFNLNDVEFAYSGHTIEHLSDAAVRRLFANLFGSMRKGGVFRIEVPDLDLLLDDYKCVHNSERKVTRQMLELVRASFKMPPEDSAYAQEHIHLLAGIVSYFDRKYNAALPPVCSATEFHEKLATLTNSEFGDWAVSLMSPEQLRDSYLHRNWFNFAKLQKLLTEAGFSGVVQCEAGETRYNFKMNINRRHRAWCSLFVEAIKN
jgi:hypothetical protein